MFLKTNISLQQNLLLLKICMPISSTTSPDDYPCSIWKYHLYSFIYVTKPNHFPLRMLHIHFLILIATSQILALTSLSWIPQWTRSNRHSGHLAFSHSFLFCTLLLNLYFLSLIPNYWFLLLNILDFLLC